MAKGIMIVDGQRVPFDGEKNVLAVIRKAGIDMPTFCYYSELSVHGACRMCIVENVKTGKIDASCSMEPRDGMRIRTNTSRLLKYRRMILELMLSSHDRDCTTCAKSGNCRLQALAQRFGVSRVRFPDTRERYEQDNTSLAIFRDPNKCILCGDCVRVCEELQGQGILNYAHRGSELQVMPAFDQKLADTNCISCGQCAAACPTGAITFTEREAAAYDEQAVLENKQKKAAAAQQQDGAHHRHRQHDAGHVRLHRQQDDHRHKGQHRHHQLLPHTHPQPLPGGKQDAALRVQPLHLRRFGRKMGTEQDHLKLCHLGGL